MKLVVVYLVVGFGWLYLQEKLMNFSDDDPIYSRFFWAGFLLIWVGGTGVLAWNRRAGVKASGMPAIGYWFVAFSFGVMATVSCRSWIQLINALGRGRDISYAGTVSFKFSVKASDSSHIGDSARDAIARTIISDVLGRSYYVSFIDSATKRAVTLSVGKSLYDALRKGSPFTTSMHIGLLGIPYRWAWDPGPPEKLGAPIPVATPVPKAGRMTPGKAGVQWISIPGGNYLMGSNIKKYQEGPPHMVTVSAFEMAKTQVTNKQYKACVAAGACKAPKDFGPAFSGDDQPVVGADYEDAKAFSAWVGGRLPSEAQWEYAARSAGQDWQYPWGNEPATCERAIIGQRHYMVPEPACGRSATWPVCSKPAGNSAQGLCDLASNAAEWIEDWYHAEYGGAPDDGSAWEEETHNGHIKVVRGGCWDCAPDYRGRATARWEQAPDRRDRETSFRPVR